MSVPKFHIWSRLKGLIEDGRLWLPETDRAKALQKELRTSDWIAPTRGTSPRTRGRAPMTT